MRARTFVESMFWWSVTILTLFLLDDMINGPLFWALSLVSQAWATIAAFCIPIATQQWLIRQAMREQPAKFAAFALAKLSLERKNRNIHRKEEQIKARASKYTGAALVAPLIGGVIPTLVLYRQGLPRSSVLRFSWIPTIIYAAEFAALHGGWGFGALVRNFFS